MASNITNTGLPNTNTNVNTNANLAENKYSSFTERRLRQTSHHVKLVDLFGGLMLLSGALLGSLLLLCLIDAWVFELSTVMRVAAFAMIMIGCIGFIVWQLLPLLIRKINPAYAAKMIEDGHPELKNSLLNYVFLQRIRPANKNQQVVAQAMNRKAAEDLSHISVETAIDSDYLIRSAYFMVAVLAIFGLYKAFSPKDPITTLSRIVAPLSDISRPSRIIINDVTPGDVEVFFGDRVQITAKISGLRDDEIAQLVYSTEDGQIVNRQIPMPLNTDQNCYTAKLNHTSNGIQQNLIYSIQAGDGTSKRHHVTVRSRPSFVIQSIKVKPPQYTNIEPFEQSQGNIASVDGAKITISALANLPIERAFIRLMSLPDEPKTTTKQPHEPAQNDPSRPHSKLIGIESVPMEIIQNQSIAENEKQQNIAVGHFRLQTRNDRVTPRFTHYEVSFLTADGIKNKNPTVYRIITTPDLKPEVEITEPPVPTVSLPANGSLAIKVRARDLDYSIKDIRVIGNVRGRRLLSQPIMPKGVATDLPVDATFTFKPQQFRLRAGDEIVVHAVATDNRHASLTDFPDPNVAKSEAIRIKIVLPETKKSNNDQQEKKGEQPNEQKNDQPNKEGDQEDSGGKTGDSGTGKTGDSNELKEENGPNDEPGKNDEASDKREKDGDPDTEKKDSKSGKKDENQSPKNEPENQQPDKKSGNGSLGSDDSEDSQKSDQSTGGNSSEQKSNTDTKSSSSSKNDPNQSNETSTSESAEQQDSNSQNIKPSQSDDDATKDGSGGTGQEISRKNSDSQPEGESAQGPGNGSGDDSDRPVDHPGEAFEKIKKQMEERKKQKESQPDPENPKEVNSKETSSKETGSKETGSKETGSKETGSKETGSKETGSKETDSKETDSKETGSKETGSKETGSKETDSKETGSKETGSKETGSKETGSKETDSKETDSKETGSKETDSKETDSKETDSKETGSKETDSKETDSKETDSKETDSKETDSKETDSKETGSKETDSKETGSKETDSKETDSKETDSKETDSKKPDSQGGHGDRDPNAASKTTAEDSPDGDDANLEYTRKTTDMVLDYLKDQTDLEDESLLKELNWTPEQMQDFYQKWEQMRKQSQQGNKAQRAQYEDALRSLGLKNERAEIDRASLRQQKIDGLREKGTRSKPPTHLLEEFRSFSQERRSNRTDR